MVVGFSTGSLALADVRLGLQMVAGQPAAAIELSALREAELPPLIEMIDTLDLSQFRYISVHAPSRLESIPEFEAVSLLGEIASRGWPIIVHPDVIQDFSLWRRLGDLACLENMDKRKSTGRTAGELAAFFSELPSATLCFDIGHARQIDPTMCEAHAILTRHAGRLRQIHMSLVNSASTHEPLNYESLLAFRRVVHLIPKDIPIILETPVSVENIPVEIEQVAKLMQGAQQSR